MTKMLFAASTINSSMAARVVLQRPCRPEIARAEEEAHEVVHRRSLKTIP